MPITILDLGFYKPWKKWSELIMLSSSPKFEMYLVLVPSRPEDELLRRSSQDDSSRPTEPLGPGWGWWRMSLIRWGSIGLMNRLWLGSLLGSLPYKWMYATAFSKLKRTLKRNSKNKIFICESNLLILDEMPNLNVECSICNETITSDGRTISGA